ncbi:MAG: hypothetical protein AABZ53_02940 [Planctomycetota bacterium]
MSSYIPSRDADLESWLQNFKTLIAATPTNYGLVAADGTAITTSYTAWHTAFLAATNPTTRTKITVAAKNQQKALTLVLVRGYAATIRANLAVSDAFKAGLGLHIKDTQPTPVPPPSTYPVLAIRSMGAGLQNLIATDQGASDSRARPVGSAGLLIYRAIATGPVGEPTAATFLAFVGRPALQSTFISADSGKTATYFARWTNAKGEMGPWSPPVSLPIAA